MEFNEGGCYWLIRQENSQLIREVEVALFPAYPYFVFGLQKQKSDKNDENLGHLSSE